MKSNPASSELGVELFYYILSLISEETLSYLPTKQLFSECLEKLGQVSGHKKNNFSLFNSRN